MAKDRLVVVDWIDTTSNSKWVDKNQENGDVSLCRTIGYLYKKTSKKIMVYATYEDGGCIADRTCIPRGCIRRIKYIKEPK